MATENDTSTNAAPPAIDLYDVANSLHELRILADLIMDKAEAQWPADYAQTLPASLLINNRNHDADHITYLAGKIVGVVKSLEGCHERS